MDFVFFNAGECNDSMRDREFLLVRDASSSDDARERLYQYFLRQFECEAVALASTEDQEVFVYGPHIWDNYEDIEHWNYKMVLI